MKEKQEEIFQLVRKYKSGSLSRMEFCKQHNISFHALRNWVTLYNKTFPIHQEELKEPGFHLVQVAKDTTITAYEITYPNGVSLKCEFKTSIQQLQSLIQLW